MAQIAANNGSSKTTKCTPFCIVQEADLQMSYSGESMKEQDHRRLHANQVRANMQHIHEHLRVEMRRSLVIQKVGANRGRIPAPSLLEVSQVCLDVEQIPTMRPTPGLDWKRLGLCKVVYRISPYTYELDSPESIRIHWVQPISLLDPVATDHLIGQRLERPLLVEVDCDEEYQVSTMEDSWVYGNHLQ